MPIKSVSKTVKKGFSQKGATNSQTAQNNSQFKNSQKKPIKIDYEKLVEVTIKHSQITRIAFAAFEEMWKVEISLCFFKDGTKNANGNNSQAQKTKEKVH